MVKKAVSPAQTAARKHAWELFVIDGAAKNLERLELPSLATVVKELRSISATRRKG